MARKADAQQLRLEVVSTERPDKPRRRRNPNNTPATLDARLALSPDEAAVVLGVSRDYLDQHILPELRIVRRGRRILIPRSELERWLDRSAARGTVIARA
jgi:excisionase family DNA binding protein